MTQPPPAPPVASRTFPVFFDKVGGLNQRAQAATWVGRLVIEHGRVALEGDRFGGTIAGNGILAHMEAKRTKAATFEIASMAVRYDPKLQRLTLFDPAAGYWAILTNSNALGRGDAAEMQQIASALQEICPRFETGSVAGLPTQLKIFLAVMGALVLAALVFTIMLQAAR